MLSYNQSAQNDLSVMLAKDGSCKSSEASMSDVVKNLAYEFRANGKMRPAVLLGAGASFRSGIPLAEEAVRRIAQSAYARLKLGLAVHDSRIVLSDWLPFL